MTTNRVSYSAGTFSSIRALDTEDPDASDSPATPGAAATAGAGTPDDPAHPDLFDRAPRHDDPAYDDLGHDDPAYATEHDRELTGDGRFDPNEGAPIEGEWTPERTEPEAEAAARKPDPDQPAPRHGGAAGGFGRARPAATPSFPVPPVSPARSAGGTGAWLAAAAVALAACGWYFAFEHRTTPVEHELARAEPIDPAPARGAVDPVKRAAAIRARRTPAAVEPRALHAFADLENRTARRSFVRYERVQKGDTFVHLLGRAGVGHTEAMSAITTMSGIYDVRRIRPGQQIAVVHGLHGHRDGQFLGVRFDSSFDTTVQIERQANGEFVASEVKKDLSLELVRGNGTIDGSLFQAGLAAGVPAATMVRLIHLFSFTVDFQRDIRRGDSFEVLFRLHRDEDGSIVRQGDVVYASLTLSGTTHRMYRWRGDAEDPVEYLDEKGRSSRSALMRTPIDGARMSSGFGMRRHPILGFSRLHAGVDFAAPPGTPIYAAGDGTIEYLGWNGGYGNYIRIRHNREYATAYAHMRGFAQGLKVGSRVRQGQTIGYVGTTGVSTGPHLHYEVHRHGKQVNPMTLDLPRRKQLDGKDLARFLAHVKRIDGKFGEMARNGASTRVMAASTGPSDHGCVNGMRLDPTDRRPCKSDE